MEKELEKLLAKANVTLDKVFEVAPEIIQKYIEYKKTWFIIEPLLLLIPVLLIIFVPRFFMSKEEIYEQDSKYFGKYCDYSVSLLLYIVLFFVSIFFFISLCISIHGLVLINTSPDVFIVKEFLINK